MYEMNEGVSPRLEGAVPSPGESRAGGQHGADLALPTPVLCIFRLLQPLLSKWGHLPEGVKMPGRQDLPPHHLRCGTGETLGLRKQGRLTPLSEAAGSWRKDSHAFAWLLCDSHSAAAFSGGSPRAHCSVAFPSRTLTACSFFSAF